ncbi:MAG: hypothetical protein EVB11_09980 [Winogradskyella sp.]|nr:MAG: hypothetical protein EVB11_09980 [Winogradskyella sp.]
MEGDLEGFKSYFHEDAVIIFASGKNKTSLPISTTLELWNDVFKNTKEEDHDEYRFSILTKNRKQNYSSLNRNIRKHVY